MSQLALLCQDCYRRGLSHLGAVRLACRVHPGRIPEDGATGQEAGRDAVRAGRIHRQSSKLQGARLAACGACDRSHDPCSLGALVPREVRPSQGADAVSNHTRLLPEHDGCCGSRWQTLAAAVPVLASIHVAGIKGERTQSCILCSPRCPAPLTSVLSSADSDGRRHHWRAPNKTQG